MFRNTIITAALGALLVSPALAQSGDQGVTATEIKLGQTQPYSGPVSVYSIYGKTIAAYFQMVNEKGGIDGKKINFISLDDEFSPPRTVEATRKLVESENVFALVGSMGSGTQVAVQRYLNEKKVPQLFSTGTAETLFKPKEYPYTIPYGFSYLIEGEILAKYVKAKNPSAKIGVLYQNDDFGRTYLQGFKNGLAGDSAMLVKEAAIDVQQPLVDSQILTLKASGADVIATFVAGKAVAQSIKKVAELGWKPLFVTPYVSSSVPIVLKPAGLDISTGIVTTMWMKDPSDADASKDNDVKQYLDFVKQRLPGTDPNDPVVVQAYNCAAMMEMALRRTAPDWTRDNLIKQIQSMKNIRLPLMLDGQTMSFSADDYYAIRQAIIGRFDGTRYQPISELINVPAPTK